MYPSVGVIAIDNHITEQHLIDLRNEENLSKWKGVFKDSLAKVLSRVHVTLTASDDALQHVESLIAQVLLQLCSRPQPHSVQDVEERVEKMFPSHINKWSLNEARSALEKGRKRASLLLPVERIHTLLNKEVLQHRVDYQVTLFISAVLEYIADDILTLVGKYTKNIHHISNHVITTEHIKTAISADQVLLDVFEQDGCQYAFSNVPEDDTPITHVESYDDAVRDIIVEERAYLRSLNLIIRVFKSQVQNLPNATQTDIDGIFGNIADLYECTVKVVGQLEDALEMAEGGCQVNVGRCFEELAEESEFDVYERYCDEVLHQPGGVQHRLWQLLDASDSSHNGVATAGHGFREAVKYVLPKLLMLPVTHALSYFDSIKLLYRLSESEEDQEVLEQVQGMLKTLQIRLERALVDCGAALSSRRRLGDPFTRAGRSQRVANLQKMRDIQSSIDGWEGKDITQSGCSELIAEGVLGKVGGGSRKLTERHVFLFDGLLLMCKPNNVRRAVSPVSSGEFRLKERLSIRKLEVLDRPNTDELGHSFELVPRTGPSIVLFATSALQKTQWMTSLIMLTTRSMLERSLDMILLDEEKKNPLQLPDSDLYRFSEPDSPENIVMEQLASGVPLIKGATLMKLVERLTYHMYADPMLVRTFLTTFRSFCTAQDLLTLLMLRYDIPDPSGSSELSPLPVVDQDDFGTSSVLREDVKRFRKEYSQPVKFRVLNVLRHWVDHHFYDFEREPDLLVRLQQFIASIRVKVMRKWADSILKIIDRKTVNAEDVRPVVFGLDRSPPVTEWHLVKSEDECTFTPDDMVRPLLMLHPIELARQLTLLEFDLYCAVKPSELVGAVWTKPNKEITSPNLLRMIHHNTNMSRWMERCVVDCDCLEERRAVVCRLVEITAVLLELNNFSGVLEVTAALNGAAVHRLSASFEEIPPKLERVLDEARDWCDDHYKRYQEKLRSINPPCVPFFGMYLTNILHIEEGNPDFLSDSEWLINFSKRRKVAEITGEIQQFQNLPYCLHPVPAIRNFLANVQPFSESATLEEINNYLYTRSLTVEPRNCRTLPKLPRKWPDLPLKSPGIKPRRSNVPHPLPSLRSTLHPVELSVTPAGETPRVLTPPTPASSTVSSPPHSADVINRMSSLPTTPSPGVSSRDPALPPPPPLPPRARRSCRLSSLTSPTAECRVRQAPDAPLLPPRSSSPPPPRPPRRDLPPPLSVPPTTLPRRLLPDSEPPVQTRLIRSAGHLPAASIGSDSAPLSSSIAGQSSSSTVHTPAASFNARDSPRTRSHFTFNFDHCHAHVPLPLPRWTPPSSSAPVPTPPAYPQLPPKPFRPPAELCDR